MSRYLKQMYPEDSEDDDDYDDDYDSNDDEKHSNLTESVDNTKTLEDLRKEEQKREKAKKSSPPSVELKSARKAGEAESSVQLSEDAVVLTREEVDIFADRPALLKETSIRAARERKNLVNRFRIVDQVDFRPASVAQVMRWSRWNAPDTSFAKRSGHTATVIPVRKYEDSENTFPLIVFFGGMTTGKRFVESSVQSFDPAKGTWNHHSVKGRSPISRMGHTATLDATGDKLIIIGGISRDGERLATLDVLHGCREMKDLSWNFQHPGQFHRVDGKVYPDVHAAETVTDWCGCSFDGWGREDWNSGPSARKKQNYLSPHWVRVPFSKSSDPLPPLSQHCAVLRGQCIYVIGGSLKDQVYTNDMWRIDFNNYSSTQVVNGTDFQYYNCHKGYWASYQVHLTGSQRVFFCEKLKQSGNIPSPRAGHAVSLTSDGASLVLVGGHGSDPNQVFLLHMNSLVWTAIDVMGLPSLALPSLTRLARSGRYLLFGGFGDDYWVQGNVYILSQDAEGLWKADEVNVPGEMVPSGRAMHTASLVGDMLYLSSGFGADDEVCSDMHVMHHALDSSGFVSSLGTDLFKSFDDPALSDVSFLVEGKQIFCHRAILSSRSKQMQALFSGSNAPNVIEIADGVTYDVFRAMLAYLYQDKLTLRLEHARALIDLADKYGLDQLSVIAQSCFTVVQIPPSRLNSDIGWALSSGLFSDVVVTAADGVDIPCHRVVLVNRSVYFRAMLSSGLREDVQSRILLPETERPVVDAILRFIYTDTLDADVQLAFDVFCDVALYQITALQERCEFVLLESLDDDNVCILLDAAVRVQSEFLRDRCMAFVNRRFSHLLENGFLKALSRESAEQICEWRKSRGLFLGSFEKSVAVMRETGVGDEYVDELWAKCSKCHRDFVFQRSAWVDGGENDKRTPKDALHDLVKGDCHYTERILALGHGSSVKVKGKVFAPARAFGSKRDAQQNAALMALHSLQCGIKV